MQGMSNYVSGSFMSEHNMRMMKIECMQLEEQKHAKWRSEMPKECNVVRGKKTMKEKIREAQRVFKGYIE